MNLPGLVMLGALSTIFSGSGRAESIFNVAVPEDGRYRINFEDLDDNQGPVPSSTVRMYEQGVAIPVQVEDGGDGIFGPDDSVLFTGRRLAGLNSWYNPHSQHNIYQLYLNTLSRGHSPKSDVVAGPVVQHFEQETIRIALPHSPKPELVERWYWQRVTHLANNTFSHKLMWDTPPQALRVALTGLSRDKNATAAGMPQHQVSLRLDGEIVDELSWDGQESVTFEINDAEVFKRVTGGALLEIIVPSRTIAASGQTLIDAVLLNWIEVEYPPSSIPAKATISARSGDYLLLVSESTQSPDRITRAQPAAGLSDPDQQADYLMITHPSLLEELQPLAAHHRQEGLAVKVVDVQSIYEEFNHGIKSPYAIRKFISHAWHTWQRPAPRLVLLAGDASWERDSDAANARNLIPTLQVQVNGELAASDNGLVTIDGDDWRPDLAIGRLPAGSANELSTMVAKLLRYAQNAPDGSWRNRTTWISDVDPEFQNISNLLSDGAAAQGLAQQRIYPTPGDTAGDQLRIIESFNEGSLLVHFLGHGGRYVWRTGPRDLAGATDLFGLEDIESLHRNRRLPLVLSMTCSSGPFDHPTADSIAEAFLHSQDKGAIGVLAASWRIPASKRFSKLLIDALLQTEYRIGEAVMQAKRLENRRILVESYNLLGDPALRLASSELR
ncbi:MAG: hypothetical protein ACJA09_001742 [Alcanivorax sp.]|jgi:hypothetical protein